MRFIKHDERGWHLDAYLHYVEEYKARFPDGAREFISQPWHFDIAHHQCPHDAWLENFTVREAGSGPKRPRKIEMVFRFLGAYHDGYFELTYMDVSAYTLEWQPAAWQKMGHSDWIVDEITIDETNGIVHEILFPEARWIIRCADLQYRWFPLGMRLSVLRKIRAIVQRYREGP